MSICFTFILKWLTEWPNCYKQCWIWCLYHCLKQRSQNTDGKIKECNGASVIIKFYAGSTLQAIISNSLFRNVADSKIWPVKCYLLIFFFFFFTCGSSIWKSTQLIREKKMHFFSSTTKKRKIILLRKRCIKARSIYGK